MSDEDFAAYQAFNNAANSIANLAAAGPHTDERHDSHLAAFKEYRDVVAALIAEIGDEKAVDAKLIVDAVVDTLSAWVAGHGPVYDVLDAYRAFAIVQHKMEIKLTRRAGEKQPAWVLAHSSTPPATPLLDRVLAALTSNQSHIMQHLWDRGTASYETLRTIPHACAMSLPTRRSRSSSRPLERDCTPRVTSRS